MRRILLAIEDYGELVFFQTLLKKLGFDVEGVQNQRSYEDSVLSMNPQIIIVSARGKSLQGMEIARNTQKHNGMPKLILLTSDDTGANANALKLPAVDRTLETPVSPRALLQVLADVAEINPITLLNKYKTLRASLSPEKEGERQILNRDQGDPQEGEQQEVEFGADRTAGGPRPSTLSAEDRKKRFESYIQATEEPEQDGFSRKDVAEYNKDIRAQEDKNEDADLDEQRQGFVRALFNANKSSQSS